MNKKEFDEGRKSGLEIKFEARKDGEFAVFSLSDNGNGVSDGDLARIFEPFLHRTKADGFQDWGFLPVSRL